MAVIKPNGALWHSDEHRIPTSAVPRTDPARLAALEVAGLHREVGRWKGRAAELERRLAEAESRALSAQFPPHFLCNSLQAVSALLNRDPRAADAMVLALSDLLRVALRGSDVPEVALSRELGLLQRYVDVMRFRFGSGLQLRITTAPEARDALVPQLLLQPLVENAIRHGLAERAGTVTVSAERRGDMLRCTVSDDGRGLPPGPLVEGIGLGGTRRRLRALYGDRHRLELRTTEQAGATATVAIPYRSSVEGRR